MRGSERFCPPEPEASGQAPCRGLSRVLTPVYKLGFSATLLTIGVVCTCLQLKHRPVDSFALGLALEWAFILLLAYFCFRLKKVVAYTDRLLVSNYITHCDVPYGNIDEITGYRGRSAVFVKLRLQTACRFGCTIHFLLPSKFATIESQPEFRLLREKCPDLCEISRSRWLGRSHLGRAAPGGTTI